MTDDQQLRSLLALAAEPSEHLQPPVVQLLERGRRARKVRAACSVLGAAAIAAAAFALPAAIHSTSAHPPPDRASRYGGGPSAAQLVRFRWSELPSSPLGPRYRPLLAWTGTDLLELGGSANGTPQHNGAVFDPATRRWHLIARIPKTVGLAGAVTIWTGHELFVTNGTVPADWAPAVGAPAGLFDPTANRWTTTDLPRQLLGLVLRAAVWTGRDVVVAAVGASGNRGNARRLAVASYDPSTNRWHVMTPQLPSGHQPVDLALVATPGRVLLWSLWSRTKTISKSGYAISSGLDVLALTSDNRWKTVTGKWPQQRVVQDPVYSNGTIFIPPGQIWCGTCSHPAFDYPAYLADATTLAQRAVPVGPLVHHPGVEPSIWLWNGRSTIAANVSTYGSAAERAWINQMAVFDPAANRWTGLPVPTGRPPVAANPLWAGRELLMLTANGGLLAFHR